MGEGKPWMVWDGAHTSDSATVLAGTLRQAFPGQPLALVVAMASDKDHSGVFLTACFLLELLGCNALTDDVPTRLK